MIDIESPFFAIPFAAKLCGNVGEAKTFLKISAKYTNSVELLDHIAQSQNEIKDYANCVETLKKANAIAINPTQKYAIRANLAKIYNHMNEPDRSLGYSTTNLSLNINDYEALMETSFSHYLRGDYEKSEFLNRKLNSDPKAPEDIRKRTEYNIGSYDIENGDFEVGLEKFIRVGHEIGIWKTSPLKHSPWDGTIDCSKHLIVYSEGGIGDEIITFRFARSIQDRGMKVIWVTQNKHLVSVFSRSGIETYHLEAKVELNSDKYVSCYSMFIPILLKCSKEEVRRVSYIQPSQEYINKWQQILPTGPKLAVKWSGNPDYEQDLHRSIPLHHIKGIPFNGTKVNLQLEKENFQDDMFNAGELIKDIDDTLAILWLCDDLVSSCTGIVHMNGALGKRGIVCPPIPCYYVWLGDAVWYESLTVFRQRKHKCWNEVFENVSKTLDSRNNNAK